MQNLKREERLAGLFFLLCALATAGYLIFGYGAYLDSDMSSELALAQHLARKGALVSGEWYYSTEVRLLSTQLVFTPLMALFGHNWRLVRTLGCMLLLAMMAASTLFACRAAGAKRPISLVLAGLGISVCSPLYAQNVIIGAYYIPHIALGMLFVGGVLRRKGRCASAALLLLSFVLGVCSVRYLLQIVAPCVAALLLRAVFPGEREKRDGMVFPLLLLAFAGAGYALSTKLMPMLFHENTGYYSGMMWRSWSANDMGLLLQNVLYGLLSALGFQESIEVLSLHGIGNALVLLTVACAILLSIRGLKNPQMGENSRRMVWTAFFCALLSLAAFMLISSVYFDRYWIPVLAMSLPALAACLSAEENAILRRLSILLLAGTVLLESALCINHSMRHPQVDTEMRMEAVNVLQERGLTHGYATFWNANIVTELSNGEIEVTTVELTQGQDGQTVLKPYRWLETEESFRPVQGSTFVLLGTWEDEKAHERMIQLGAEKAGIDGYIELYILPDASVLPIMEE